MKKNYLRKSGITLIELVIVVVIIGIISSLAITKFTQGNYSDQAKITRLEDYAKKIAASARHARDINSETGLSLARHGVLRTWSANMSTYMTNIEEEIIVYIGNWTGAAAAGDFNNDGTFNAGDTDANWEFVDTDEVVFLYDPSIADTNKSISGTQTLISVTVFGDLQHYTANGAAANFDLTEITPAS